MKGVVKMPILPVFYLALKAGKANFDALGPEV
jgi:hypothetical protein